MVTVLTSICLELNMTESLTNQTFASLTRHPPFRNIKKQYDCFWLEVASISFLQTCLA